MFCCMSKGEQEQKKCHFGFSCTAEKHSEDLRLVSMGLKSQGQRSFSKLTRDQALKTSGPVGTHILYSPCDCCFAAEARTWTQRRKERKKWSLDSGGLEDLLPALSFLQGLDGGRDSQQFRGRNWRRQVDVWHMGVLALSEVISDHCKGKVFYIKNRTSAHS